MPDADRIASRIVAVRGRRVIVDAGLAALYGVPTKRLNQQVRRNPKRFPADFVFRLSDGERAEVAAKCDHLARLRFSVNLPLEILRALRELTRPAEPPKRRRIGFVRDD